MRARTEWWALLVLGMLSGVLSGCTAEERVYLLDDEDAARRGERLEGAAGRPVPMPEEVSTLRASPDDARPAASLEDLAAPRGGAGEAKPGEPTAMPVELRKGRAGA